MGELGLKKVNGIDKNTYQCFALLLVDKNSVKNQTALKIPRGTILNLQTCFESPGIERASLSTCRNGSPEKDIQNWHQLKIVIDTKQKVLN